MANPNQIGLRNDSNHRVTSDLDALEVTQNRTLGAADVGGLGATGVKGAAAGRVERVGYFALHGGASTTGDHETHEVQWAQCINAAR